MRISPLRTRFHSRRRRSNRLSCSRLSADRRMVLLALVAGAADDDRGELQLLLPRGAVEGVFHVRFQPPLGVHPPQRCGLLLDHLLLELVIAELLLLLFGLTLQHQSPQRRVRSVREIRALLERHELEHLGLQHQRLYLASDTAFDFDRHPVDAGLVQHDVLYVVDAIAERRANAVREDDLVVVLDGDVETQDGGATAHDARLACLGVRHVEAEVPEDGEPQRHPHGQQLRPLVRNGEQRVAVWTRGVVRQPQRLEALERHGLMVNAVWRDGLTFTLDKQANQMVMKEKKAERGKITERLTYAGQRTRNVPSPKMGAYLASVGLKIGFPLLQADAEAKMACTNAGGAPCAWVEHYQQAKNELLLAQYEAQRWKEKYLLEKQRRRKLARSLLDTMALVEETKRANHTNARDSVLAADVVTRGSHSRPRRSSSTFSDKDQIESLLSPTLSSFDFDDDDELEDDDGDAGSSSSEQEDADGKAATTNGSGGATKEGVVTAAVTASNRRSSVLRAASEREVRPTRSSTLGSYDVRRVSQNGKGLANGWRRGTNQTLPPSNLLYRMLYTKSSSRDLWSTQSNRFHSVARSVMFSMQLKKEHVFEHFFVVGLQIGETERAQASSRRSGGLAGFWKPKTFYEFPQRAGRAPDASIADFCFPMGVPIVECKPHQYATLLGAPVSIWSTDAEELQKHALDPFRSSGYTFRLTGAKGEVLYGFCVAVMSELVTTKDAADAESSGSPRGEWSKRASCPNGSALRMTDPTQKSYGASSPAKKDSGRKGKRRDPSTDVRYLAPVCYCFTSKFPFYKLHFAILRMVIENTLRASKHVSGATIRNPDLYDVTLTVESTLGVEFAVCRQPNAVNLNDGSSSNGANSTNANVGSFSSVSSGIHRDRLGDVALSEEVASASHASSIAPTSSHDDGGNHPRRANGLKKSFSSDDITSYDSSTACVVEKPVVVRMSEPTSPRVAAQVQVGDVLEAIDGISTASLTFTEALELIQSSPRPLKLRFHRLTSRKLSDANHSVRAPTLLSVVQEESVATPPPTSIDILQRVRRFRIGDPGEWSSLRLPDYAVNYQFPKRDAERWAVGVVLRYVTPDNIVKILAHLLLEKQVVIMGANSSLVTATCTALLLLLAPFQWQSTYIPQLPASLLDFLHSPVPFLVGCQPLDVTDDWPDVCFVNIDTNVILAPIADHHINSKSIPHGGELTRLFQGAAQRYQRLRLTSKPWHELSDDEDKLITLTMQESQIFLKDVCGELTSLNFAPEAGKSFYEQLQQEVTSIVRKSNFEDFLEEFSQTQMFCQYCETVLKAERDEDAKFAVRNGNRTAHGSE